MAQEIIPIQLNLPFKMGSVNCYLINNDTKFVLVDTGCPNNSKELERKLDQYGCNSDNLQLILITHGDFDHSGNAAFLKRKYGTNIGIHPNEVNVVKNGDMFSNRMKSKSFQNLIIKTLFGFGKSQRFEPDIEVANGFDLSEHGVNARVIHIPGHSNGSIGILTDEGDLFCGDLLENTDGPKLNRLMDDLEKAKESMEILQSINTNNIYPGHGNSFTISSLLSKSNN